VRKTAIALAFLAASPLVAQQVTVGLMPPNPLTSGLVFTTVPVTYVDLTHHATGNGTINKVSVQWTATCSNAFKIVFLRGNLSSVSTFTPVDVRGPFSVVAGRNDLTLTPPVTVQAFDYIGLVQLQTNSICGTVALQPSKAAYRLATNKDMSAGGPVGTSNSYASGFQMALFAYNSDPVLVRVLPVAGAVQGIGTFFRTSVQLYNPNPTAITGKLVFHPAGQSAGSSDPSLDFIIGQRQTRTFPDVVAAMGASGLGSIDVFTNGGAAPVVTARIFSDNGAAGTLGFTEEGLPPAEALSFLTTGSGALPMPPNFTNFRMNIGVRTLDSGATLSVAVVDEFGVAIGLTRSVSFPPNWFEQQTANVWSGLTTLPPNGSILITPTAGSAFVYGSITDNRTQDSSMRFATIR
jgi:hypothetical protein